MTLELLGLRTVIHPVADLEAAKAWWTALLGDAQAAVDAAVALGATVHTPASEVGQGIVTATVRTPQGSIVGFIVNPHFRS